MILETILVADPDGIHPAIAINKDDYDPNFHQLLDDPKGRKKKARKLGTPEPDLGLESQPDPELSDQGAIDPDLGNADQEIPDDSPKGFVPAVPAKGRKRRAE